MVTRCVEEQVHVKNVRLFVFVVATTEETGRPKPPIVSLMNGSVPPVGLE